MNTVIANTGASLLALVFLAGAAASVAQLLRWWVRLLHNRDLYHMEWRVRMTFDTAPRRLRGVAKHAQ